MAVVVVHDWRFGKNGDPERGFAAAEEYVRFLKSEKVSLSMWLRAKKEPLRAFHVVVFDSLDRLQKAAEARETERFTEQLYPEIDRKTHVAPKCDVVLSSGGRIPEVQGGQTPLVTVVNEWNFSPEGDVERGMKAAERYVEYFQREKPQVKLSLWLQSSEHPLHHYHVSVFDDAKEAVAGIRWEGTERFAAELYPEIDAESVDQPHCDVVLSSGGQLDSVPWRGAAS